jgi:hypothetical protein
MIQQAMTGKAVGSGKVTAAGVAQLVFDAIASNKFYIYSHPKAINSVQTRLEDVLQARNPTDPFADKPEIGQQLKAALARGLMRRLALAGLLLWPVGRQCVGTTRQMPRRKARRRDRAGRGRRHCLVIRTLVPGRHPASRPKC